jgi:DNA-binding CsgD family transcriptional regulator
MSVFDHPTSQLAHFKITRREREVIALLLRGSQTKAIAAELSISPTTVTDHIGNMLEKTNTSTRVALVSALFGLTRLIVAFAAAEIEMPGLANAIF